MSTDPLRKASNRLAAFNAIKAGGMSPRDAGIAAFPELPPDTAAVAPQAIVVPTMVPESAAAPGIVSREMLRQDARVDFVAKGMDPAKAKILADSAASFVPESGSPIEYQKIANAVRDARHQISVDPVEQALVKAGVLKDVEMVGTTLYAAFGGAQQALFGAMAGEGPSTFVDRLWPDVDIREDDGTVVRKALVPQALKAMGNAVLSLGLESWRYAMTTPDQRPFEAKAEKFAQSIVDSDFRDNMLTGQEVVEYWMGGTGLFSSERIPDVGTPERATYDATLRDTVAVNLATLSDKKFGGAAMAGISLGGALLDVVMDPAMIVSGAPSKGVELTRKLLPVSSRARMTGAIAERTGRMEHVLTAYADAQAWVKEAGEVAAASNTPENMARFNHAKKMQVRLKARLDAFAAGPSESFLLPTSPRIHPDHIRDVAAAYRSVPREGRKAAMVDFINGRVRETAKAVKAAEKAVERANNKSPDLQQSLFTEAQMGSDTPSLEARLRDLIAERDAWKETRKWAMARIKNPGARTTGFLDEALSKMEPYQSKALPPDMIEGAGFKPLEFPRKLVSRALSKLPVKGPTSARIETTHDLINAVGRGAPAEEIRALVEKLDNIGSPLHGGTEAAYDEFDALVAKLGSEEAAVAATQEALDTFYAGLSRELGRGRVHMDVANKLHEMLRPLLQQDTDPSGALRKLYEATNPIGKSGQTPWDAVVATTVADAERVQYAGMAKKDVLRRIRENIKRGVAQGAPEDEIIQWERTYTEVSRGPDVVQEIVSRSETPAHQILAESMADQRRKILGEMPKPTADFNQAGETQLRQRVAHGPDQREVASEAARILAAGGEIDDVMFHGIGIDLYNSSYGDALFPTSGTEARSAAVEWLGTDAMNTKIEAAQWQQTMAEKLGDFWAKGLYPNTWNIRPAGLLYNIREPMRVLQSANPALYTRVHNALNAQKFELTRMNSVFARELEILGVYKEVNGSYVLDPEMSRRFYQIMNMVPNGEKYELATSALTEVERRSLRRLRQELDFIGDKLGLRNTDKYLEGYIDHVWDRNWNSHGARMQEVRGLGASTEVHNPHLMTREGNTGYVEDLALALDNYASGASRKLHFEPMFEDLRTAAEIHLKNRPGDEWFAQYVDHMINNFKGRPSTVGQWVDLNMAALNARLRAHEKVMEVARKTGDAYAKQGEMMGRAGQVLSKLPGKVGKLGGAMEAEGLRISEFGSQMSTKGVPLYNIGDASRTAMGVTALSYSAVLGGSGRYFPMAIATGLATTGSRYGIFNTLRGILAMSTSEGRALAKQAGLDKQWVQIMEDAAWTKIGKLATNMPTFNGITVLGPSISATENYIRGWTFHAALGDLMRKQGFHNWDDVVEAGLGRAYLSEALRTTEEVNHLFGQLGKPPTFHRFSKSGSVAATQFLSFIPKQTEELLAQTLENPGRIMQYMMISGYLQRTAAKAGLDISEYVGAGFLPASPDDATSITMETVEAFISHGNEMGKLAAGVGDAAAAAAAGERLTRSLTNYIPLAVSTQRMTRTFDALRTGSLYSDTGALTYEFDLGGFKWDDSASVGSNLLRSYSPEFYASESGEGPSELGALRSGLSSPRQTLERTHYRSLLAASSHRMYRRREIARALEMAVSRGDGSAFDKQMRLAEQEGMIPPDLKEMVSRSALESALPRLLREELDGVQGILDASTIEPRQRAMYELQFGVEGGR